MLIKCYCCKHGKREAWKQYNVDSKHYLQSSSVAQMWLKCSTKLKKENQQALICFIKAWILPSKIT